jgi:hypothetical protein
MLASNWLRFRGHALDVLKEIGFAAQIFLDAAPPCHNPGGGERDRTDDLLLAKQALSQLSYTPG